MIGTRQPTSTQQSIRTVYLLVLALVCFLGQPKLALAQSAWTSGSLANAVRASRVHQSASQSGVKSQKHGGGKGSFEAQASGQGTNGKIAKWVDSIGALGDSVITELTGKIGIGTASPASILNISGSSPLVTLSDTATLTDGYLSQNSGYLQLGHNRNTLTGAITNPNKASALMYMFIADSDSSINFATGDTNGTQPQLRMKIDKSGNVGIGTPTPSVKLDVVGNAKVTGNITVEGIGTGNITASGTIMGGNVIAKYQDIAEWVPARHAIPAGTVVVLDTERSNHVLPSDHAYDTRVAGVVSAKPGVLLGERGEGKVMVATTGRVRVKVDATKAPIRVGDLLVTSDKEGIAMRSLPLDLGGTPIHRPGTLIGKALEPLEKGVGEILVLLSLQ